MADIVNQETGETDDFAMYRPTGPCAACGQHPATEIWSLFKGPLRYEFRCACCVVLGQLERARFYAGRIAALEVEHEAAKLVCGGDKP